MWRDHRGVAFLAALLVAGRVWANGARAEESATDLVKKVQNPVVDLISFLLPKWA